MLSMLCLQRLNVYRCFKMTFLFQVVFTQVANPASNVFNLILVNYVSELEYETLIILYGFAISSRASLVLILNLSIFFY